MVKKVVVTVIVYASATYKQHNIGDRLRKQTLIL